MLRTIFILTLTAIGVRYALTGPFYALLFYLWIAYFRPEDWVWHEFIRSLNLSLVAAVLLVGTMLISRERLRLNPYVAAILLFFVQSTISLMCTPNPSYTFPY